MSYRTITTHSRNMMRNLHVGRSSCSDNTRQNTRNDSPIDKQKQTLNDDRSRSRSSIVTHSPSTSSNHYGPSLSTDSVFRRAFKYYKKRDPRPDLSKVINPRLQNGTKLTVGEDVISNETISFLGLRPLSEWKVVTFEDRQGLFILPDLLRDSAHLPWLRRSLRYATAPNNTNIALHTDQPFSLLDDYRNLRWTTLGVQYDWTTKEYPLTRPALPSELKLLAKSISSVLCLGEMEGDAAIVNYYPQKSTLSAHVDRSERTHSVPLVSLSIGRPAVYLTGGTNLDDPVIPILLQSGDVLVMHESQRLVYHAVPCILPPGERKGVIEEEVEEDEEVLKGAENGNEQWEKRLKEYSTNCRVNITIRQVNP